jgi:TetR/AcrR family transcriptional regulator, mexJK operon transcriptional repressor
MQKVLADAPLADVALPHPGSGDRKVSGWQRKHDAIAAAALVLFARDGYERTSVDAIAAEAGVSKRTVYSHYGDKENLFLLVLSETYDVMRDRVSDIVNRTLSDVDDVEESLTACVREIVGTISRAPERATLVRLVISEAPHFPAILDLWRNRGIVPLIAAPLARLAAAGRLAADDPSLAAEHLSALTFGQVNNKSMMGTVELTDAETDRIVTNGVRAFMRAYAPCAPAVAVAAPAAAPAAAVAAPAAVAPAAPIAPAGK